MARPYDHGRADSLRRFFLPWVCVMGVGNAHGTKSVPWLPAIRKCDRKEMKIAIKSEAIAKVYVIESEVVSEKSGKKTEGSQNMRVHPD